MRLLLLSFYIFDVIIFLCYIFINSSYSYFKCYFLNLYIIVKGLTHHLNTELQFSNSTYSSPLLGCYILSYVSLLLISVFVSACRAPFSISAFFLQGKPTSGELPQLFWRWGGVRWSWESVYLSSYLKDNFTR